MTATSLKEDPRSADTGSGVHSPGGTVRVAARWVYLGALTMFAYWSTFRAIGIEMAENTLLTYLPAAAILCIIAALGVSLRDKAEPPIYDRQTDFIVGIILLLIALSFQALLNRRYLPAYLVTHIDLLSMLLFVLAGCVLLFGLRPAMRYRWVWLLSLSLFPLPYRIVVVSFGNSRVAAGAVMLILGIAATAVASGTTRRRAIIAASISAVVGTVLLVVVTWAAPTARVGLYQWIPAVGCALATTAFMYYERRRGLSSLRPFPNRRLRAPTTSQAPRAAILLAAASTALHLIGSPEVAKDAGVTVEGLRTRPPLIMPAGWHQVESTPLLPSTLNGWDGTRMRQVMAQDAGEPRFDVRARPRRVVADTVDSALPLTFDIYLPALRYSLSETRVSPETAVELPHGVTGILQTLVDDQNLLTYNRLTWRWNNGQRTQQVTLFSVDNHEADAPFPEFRRQRNSWQVVNGMLTLLFRGNAVTEDLNPRFKDRDLLVECASSLIDTQVTAIGSR